MNKPLQRVESQLLVSITDLKKNPSAVIAAAENAPVAVLNHNRVTAYVIRPEVYEYMLDRLDELKDIETAQERQDDPSIEVDIDALDTL